MRFFQMTLAFFVSTTLVPVFAAGNGARFVYDMEYNMGKEMRKAQMKYAVRKDRLRLETDINAGMMGGPFTYIVTKKPNRKIALFPSEKSYMIIPNDIDKMGGMYTKKGKKSPQKAFKKTGKKKKIAGHDCEVYERKTETEKEEACINKKLLSEYNVFEMLQSSGSSRKEKSFLPKGMEGFPLEFISISSEKGRVAGGTTKVRLRSLKRENIAMAEFEVPKNFKKKEAPKMDDAQMKKMMEQIQKSKGMNKDQQKKMMEQMKKFSDQMKNMKMAPPSQ